PLATFSVRARVLLKERYWLGREADLSPLDLTLGWGLMSDQNTLDQIRLMRGHRRYAWQGRTGFDRGLVHAVDTHSANVHIIPANHALARAMDGIHTGHIVALAGWLVEARAADGWKWRSSLTREDTGAGACELLWVEWMRVE